MQLVHKVKTIDMKILKRGKVSQQRGSRFLIQGSTKAVGNLNKRINAQTTIISLSKERGVGDEMVIKGEKMIIRINCPQCSTLELRC